MRAIKRFLQECLATRSGRIGLAAGFIALVTVLVALLLQRLGEVDSFGDGWWWAMHHLVDPGALGDDEDWTKRLLGLALTLSGLVIFVGIILEVLTEAVTRSLEYLDKSAIATTAVGHVVFVGWSERLPEVVETLAGATDLVSKGRWSGEVVVLVSSEAGRDVDELRARLRPHRRSVSVHLIAAAADDNGFRLANCEAAWAIVILPDETRLDDPAVQDLESIRRALQLAGYLDTAGRQPEPAVFFEVSRAADIDAAARLLPAHFEALVGERVLSALLRDSLLEPSWDNAMERLLSPRSLPSLAMLSDLSCGGLRFGDLSGRLDGAIPVALVPAHSPESVVVAPAPDTLLADGDRLIGTLGARRPHLLPPVPLEAVELEEAPQRDTEPYRVLLIGWNSKAPTYLEELALTLGTRFQMTSLSGVPEAERLADIVPAHATTLGLRCLEGNPVRRADVADAIAATRPRAIVITSTPVWGNASPVDVLRAADADALITLMHVTALVDEKTLPVTLDLFKSSSAIAFNRAIAFETLPSTSIFASLVTWLVIEPNAGRIASLFADPSVRRTSVVFRPADGRAHSFAAAHRALLDRRQAPIGLIADREITLGPRADHPVNPGDRLLVIERLEGQAAAGASAAPTGA